MKTLSASEAAKKLHAKRNGKNELSHMATVARITQATARIRHERDEKPVPPTPERLAKGDLTNKSDRKGTTTAIAPDIVHQIKDPADSVKKYLTEEEMRAINKFAVNLEFANRHRAITANYEGAGGGAYGSRDGGLPDRCRKAASIAEWQYRKLHPNWQKLVNLLFYGVRRAKDGNPLTTREIIAMFFPLMGDLRRRDGGFIVLYSSLAWRLQELEKELHEALKGETKAGAPLVRTISRERNAVGSDFE